MVFHLFSVEVGEIGLALTDGPTRHMEARDIYISSPSRGMTVTLQDMVVLLELHIDGPRVTRTDDRDWTMECERLLGITPPPTL